MNTGKKKILAISGSTRLRSTNETILRMIGDIYSARLDVELFDGITQLPHFNPDIEDDNVHENVTRFREKINDADGVIICTPEYVFSLPGSLKNALEWTVSTVIFTNKPVAIIVASGLGEKAFESLHLVMTTLGAQIGNAKLLIKGARSKLNENGTITDESILKEIDEVVNSLIHSMDYNVS